MESKDKVIVVAIVAFIIMFLFAGYMDSSSANYKECVKYHKPIDCATWSP